MTVPLSGSKQPVTRFELYIDSPNNVTADRTTCKGKKHILGKIENKKSLEK